MSIILQLKKDILDGPTVWLHINTHVTFWPQEYYSNVTERWGVQLLTAPKSIKQARLVERKVFFISDAGNWEGRADICPKADSLPTPTSPDKEEVRAFIG